MKTYIYLILLMFSLSSVFAAGSDNEDINYSDSYKNVLNLINQEDYKNAIKELKKLRNHTSSDYTKADIFSLLGFSSRKNDNYKDASRYYEKALSTNPSHLGALEYQGEMFVDLGKNEKALSNLKLIENLVGKENEYYKDLKNYIDLPKTSTQKKVSKYEY